MQITELTSKRAPWTWIIVVAMLGLFAKVPYRALAREHALTDLGLSNVLPDFFWIIFQIFLVSRWKRNVSLYATLLAGTLSTEAVQMRVASRTFDPWDLVAATIGWVAALSVIRFFGETYSAPRV